MQSPLSLCEPKFAAGKPSAEGRFSAAFTLVEMLAVIAIIGLLTALAVPSLPLLLGAKGVSKAITATSGILELARTEAMARKTYVRVSFLNEEISGSSALLIGAVSSLDGSGTNNDSGNLRPIGKVIKIDNAILSEALPGTVTDLAPSPNFVKDSPPGFDGFRVGSTHFPAATPTIVFSPNGEILSSAESLNFIPKADIGLVPTRGTSAQSNGSDGAIVRILGASGRIQIFRP